MGADTQTVRLEPKRHAREDISTTQNEAINSEEEHNVDKTPSSTDTAGSFSDFETVSVEKKGNLLFCCLKNKDKNL